MSELHVNFIQKSWYKNYSLVLIFIGVLGTIYTLYDRATKLAEIERQQLVLDHYQQMLEPVSVQLPPNIESNENNELDKEITLISKELISPWGVILDDLQSASNQKIKITQINIELNKPIKIIGVTEHSRFLHNFIKQLASNPSWQSIEIINEASITTDVQTQPEYQTEIGIDGKIQFELELTRALL